MATKADFTEAEWDALQKGVTGSGMLVSLSDADFTEGFGEARTLSKFIAAQHQLGATELIREISGTHTTGFGLTGSPTKVHDETLAALRSSVETLTAKAPEELGPYRELVLGACDAVAEAKSGVKPGETAAIAEIRGALGVE